MLSMGAIEKLSAAKYFSRKYSPMHRISAVNSMTIPICAIFWDRLDTLIIVSSFYGTG